MATIERRDIRVAVRANSENRTLSGIAVPYRTLSHTLHDRARPYRERFERGAISHHDHTVMMYGHDMSGVPLGRVGSGTLRFQETDVGLAFEVDLPESRSDILEALRRGDLDGSVSIGFVSSEDEWQNRTKPPIRTVRAAVLHELSVVQAGAYPTAAGELNS